MPERFPYISEQFPRQTLWHVPKRTNGKDSPFLCREHVVNITKIHLSVVSVLLASIVGCAGLNDCHYEKTQGLRALREYVRCGKPQCEEFPHDYKLGFLDGFYNIATGGPSCPPAVAPERYWNPKQVLKDCDNRRHAYYSGWQDGASRASQFPDTHHLKIFETCECPMPRCESACGAGGCVPCGLGSVGSPAHAELIETPYEQPSIMPTPAVPPAPIDAGARNSSKVSDNEIQKTASLTPAATTQQQAVPTLEMLETESIEAETANLDQTLEVAKKYDASTIFGSAFDVAQDDDAIVRMEEIDPMESVKATAEVIENVDGPKALEIQQAKVASSEPKIVVPSPSIRTVEQPESTPTASTDPIESLGTVQLVRENLIPPAETKKASSSQAVTVTEPTITSASKTESVTSMVSVKPSKLTRHPAVAIETVPVRFEMIESNVANKPATVVQAK